MVFEKNVRRTGGSERFQCFTQDTKLSLSKQKIQILTLIFLRE